MSLTLPRFVVRATPDRRDGVPASTAPASRDRAVDVARAACLVVVVLLHAMMVGVSNTDGVVVFENAMSSWDWFPVATWIVQVMPLFFVLGGFSSYTDWTARSARGGSVADYLRSRVRRLALPALAAVATTVVMLAVLTVVGVDGAIIAEAGFRTGQPLWFLAVYLMCTVLVPTAVALHRRARWLTVGTLGALVVAVDIARAITGLDVLGLLNLLFVWVLVQQIGFFVADGSFGVAGRRAVAWRGLGVVAVVAALMLLGAYPADLFAALNPPTGVLVLVGLAQAALFQLLRPALRRSVASSNIRSAVDALGAHGMTVYVWHMPVLIALAGLLLLLPGTLPEPLSLEWWQTRTLWLVAGGAAVAWVARQVGGIERRRDGAAARVSVGGSDGVKDAAAPARRAGRGAPRAVAAAALAAGGVVCVLAAGSTLAAWVLAAAGLAAGWWVAGGVDGVRVEPTASSTHRAAVSMTSH